MKKTVYVLEERGHQYMYHWFIYMLGGLRHIPNQDPSQKKYIYVRNLKENGFHRSTFDVLKDELELLDSLDENCEIYPKEFGEPLHVPDDVHHDTYIYLRNLFFRHIPQTINEPMRKLYITRKQINKAHNGNKIRHILNEELLKPILKENGFEYIEFEDYNVKDKIMLFRNAKYIISPNSASLTFSLFAEPGKTTIIEILPFHAHQHDHYKNICNTLGVNYVRFGDVDVIGDSPRLGAIWNMNVHIEKMKRLLQSLH